jgi:NadR type nicotinamide-nucleotide adenylyltransferase
MATVTPPRPRTAVLIGVESTGKTSLAAELARRFSCPWVPESARAFVDRKGGPLTADDVGPLGEEQRAAEDAGRARARDLLILDTDLVSTMVYARHYFGSCPEWIERAAAERRADLYLLHHPDVPWVDDGFQRERPAERQALHGRFEAALRALGAWAVDVKGAWEERLAAAVRAVEHLAAAEEVRGPRG